MEVIKKHITEYTHSIISNPLFGFYDSYHSIENEDKSEIESLLIYFDRILDNSINNSDSLNYIHIHIENLKDSYAQILSSFLAIRFFRNALISDQNDIINNAFENEISQIRKKLSNNTLPEGVKSYSREHKKWTKKRIWLKKRISFLKSLKETNQSARLLPNTLINLLIKDKTYLSNKFLINKFGLPLELLGTNSSYVLFNKNSFKQLKDKVVKGERLLKLIQNIIIFNSQRRSEFKDFNFSQLEKFNKSFGTKFQNLIIVTTDSEKQTFNGLKNKIETIESRFFKIPKFPNYQSYIISVNELDIILDNTKTYSTLVSFFDNNENILWEEFKYKLSFFFGLEELVSLKMMNIFSLTFNEEIKSIILDAIFCNDKSSWLKNATREILYKDITDLARKELKECLSNLLDYIISSQWLDAIKLLLTEDSLVIIPDSLNNENKIKDEIAAALGIRSNRIKDWFEKFNCANKDILILDYRDRGRYPYNIKPNINEHYFELHRTITGKFISYFFQNKYEWCEYQFQKDSLKILNHPLKSDLLSWELLQGIVRQTKPKHNEIVYRWDEENLYTNNKETHQYKVYVKGQRRPLSCYGSELFIYASKSNNSIHRVIRIDDLMKMNEDHLSIQKLEEFYDTINLAESLSPPTTQNKEISFLLKQYKLEPTYAPEKLWKKLLSDKFEQNAEIYFDLEKYFDSKNLQLVSKQRFEDSWIHTNSEILIPRGKKNFSVLCDYLKLPKSYYLIMRRIRNSGKNNERLRTSINNKMFSFLFNDGCFDRKLVSKEVITSNLKKYKKEIDFEELGIEEDTVIIGELVSLVDLLSNTINLIELEQIKISSDD